MVALPNLNEKNISVICDAIRQIASGRMNNAGEVTLAVSVDSTDVDNLACFDGMKVFFTPLTANAALEIGNGTLYVSAVTKQQFTIAHANNTQADRTFAYCLIGG